MSKKVLRQLNALKRFTVRPRFGGETDKEYNAYLFRKGQEEAALKKVRQRQVRI